MTHTIVVPPPFRDMTRAPAIDAKSQRKAMDRVYKLVDRGRIGMPRVADARPHGAIRFCEKYKIAQHAPVAAGRRKACKAAWQTAKRQAVWPIRLNSDAAFAYLDKATMALGASGIPQASKLSRLLHRYRELAAVTDSETGASNVELLRSLGAC